MGKNEECMNAHATWKSTVMQWRRCNGPGSKPKTNQEQHTKTPQTAATSQTAPPTMVPMPAHARSREAQGWKDMTRQQWDKIHKVWHASWTSRKHSRYTRKKEMERVLSYKENKLQICSGSTAKNYIEIQSMHTSEWTRQVTDTTYKTEHKGITRNMAMPSHAAPPNPMGHGRCHASSLSHGQQHPHAMHPAYQRLPPKSTPSHYTQIPLHVASTSHTQNSWGKEAAPK